VRVSAAVSTVPSWLALGFVFSPSHRAVCGKENPTWLLMLIPIMLPYLDILWRLRWNPRRKGVAVAVATAACFLVVALMPLQGMWWEGENLIGFAIPFVLIQGVLLWSAFKAYSGWKPEVQKPTRLREGFYIFALYAVICLILQAASVPPLVKPLRKINETSATGSLRTVNTAEITYASAYEAGFSASLAALGPPDVGAQPSASAAGFVDEALASGKKSGYILTYTRGPEDENGQIKSYTLTARPVKFGVTGCKSLYTDQSGILRGTREDRTATEQDPPLGE
jgi:hypothetical protein